MAEVLEDIIRTQETKLQRVVLDFKEEDEEKLWEWWKQNYNNKAVLLLLPYGTKMINGLFFHLLEDYGAKLLLEAMKLLQKKQNKGESDYTTIVKDILPLLCIKYTKMNIIQYQKKLFEKALEIYKENNMTMYEAKIKARKELVCL